MNDKSRQSYEFGPFRLDVRRRILMRGPVKVPLPPKVFETLLLLVQNNRREMTKQELIKRLWPDCFVEESNLTQNIFILRKALREEKTEHQYIVTIPGRGYHFVAEVKELSQCLTPVDQFVPMEEDLNEHRAVSIAVLPFKSFSPPEGNGFLGVGLADALILKLSDLRQVSVRPTTSILRYRETRQDLLVIGKEQNVNFILDGVYREEANRISVNANLVSVKDGATLWSGRFKESLKDLFALQDSIAEQAARLLAIRLRCEFKESLRAVAPTTRLSPASTKIAFRDATNS